MGICRDIIMINTGTISDENMTSDAWDKVKEREKKKKEGGREKKYLISMAVFIAFCSLGSIATFSKSTKDANENDNIQNEEMKQENLETDDDEGDEDTDYEYTDEENSDDYDYDDWKETYFGEEIWID